MVIIVLLNFIIITPAKNDSSFYSPPVYS